MKNYYAVLHQQLRTCQGKGLNQEQVVLKTRILIPCSPTSLSLGVKALGDSRKYPYLPWAASSSRPPLALGIPNRSTPPPCLRNSEISQTLLRNCRFFLPTDLKSPLYISNTFIKRKLILSLPPKEKNVHSAQQTINIA